MGGDDNPHVVCVGFPQSLMLKVPEEPDLLQWISEAPSHKLALYPTDKSCFEYFCQSCWSETVAAGC